MGFHSARSVAERDYNVTHCLLLLPLLCTPRGCRAAIVLARCISRCARVRKAPPVLFPPQYVPGASAPGARGLPGGRGVRGRRLGTLQTGRRRRSGFTSRARHGSTGAPSAARRAEARKGTGHGARDGEGAMRGAPPPPARVRNAGGEGLVAAVRGADGAGERERERGRVPVRGGERALLRARAVRNHEGSADGRQGARRA